MSFENIPVDGSVKLDNKISESLEPYDLSKAIPFTPSVLSGSLADHADVDAADCEKRAVEQDLYLYTKTNRKKIEKQEQAS